MTMGKYHVKSGDRVMVIAGVNKGMEGKVLRVITGKNRAVIEGDKIEKVSKHIRPNASNPDGGIIKQNPTIHISNLMVIDPANGEPARVGKEQDENGKMVRKFKHKENKES